MVNAWLNTVKEVQAKFQKELFKRYFTKIKNKILKKK